MKRLAKWAALEVAGIVLAVLVWNAADRHRAGAR